MIKQFKNSKLPPGFRPVSNENTNQFPHRMLKVATPTPEKREMLLFKPSHEDSGDKMSQKCIYKIG